jgi:hypothetical protein
MPCALQIGASVVEEPVNPGHEGNSFLQNVCTSLPNYTMRSVWNVSSHFEYLENWWRSYDVTWQPVRGDFTAVP